MIIDMHVHTKISGDSSATVEKYCRVIKKYRQYHPFDGIVLTEHCIYDPQRTYQKIGEKYGVLILQGAEVDTNLGHLLLYGITDGFLKQIDISRRNLNSQKVIKTINDCGGIAIPAHPFRDSTYGNAHRRRAKAGFSLSYSAGDEDRREKGLCQNHIRRHHWEQQRGCL